jgi:hypothetical protein
MIDVLVTSFRQDGIGVGLKIFTRSVHSKVGQAAFVVHAGQDSSFIGFSTGVECSAVKFGRFLCRLYGRRLVLCCCVAVLLCCY